MTRATLRNNSPRFRSVVSREHLKLASQRSTLQHVEERLDRRQLNGLLAHNEIVPLAVQRNEIQPERSRRGAGRETHIRIRRQNQIRGCEVSVCDAPVSMHLGGADSGLFQKLVEQSAAPRSRLA